MSVPEASLEAVATTRIGRMLARFSVVVSTFLLYNAAIIWPSAVFNRSSADSILEAIAAPVWMPVLYTVAYPWHIVPFVLFAGSYVAFTAVWPRLLTRRWPHVGIASAAAALSMSMAAVFAAIIQDASFDWTHGYPAISIPRFVLGAALAALLVSAFYSKRFVVESSSL